MKLIKLLLLILFSSKIFSMQSLECGTFPEGFCPLDDQKTKLFKFIKLPVDLQRIIVSGSLDNNLELSDKILRKLNDGASSIWSLASLGQNLMASGSADGVIRIWNTATGNLVNKLVVPACVVSCLAGLGDGRLVSGSFDHMIRLWDIHSGKLLMEFPGHEGSVDCIIYLGDDRMASGSWDESINIWDTLTGNLITTLEGHEGTVMTLVDLGNGIIASGSGDRTVKIWNTYTGEIINTFTVHKGDVRSLLYLPEASKGAVSSGLSGKIVSGSGDNKIKVWDLFSGKLVNTLTESQDCFCCLSDSQERNLIISSSSSGAIKIWDIDTGKLIEESAGHGAQVFNLINLGNGCIASGSDDGGLIVWDLCKSRHKDRIMKKYYDIDYAVALKICLFSGSLTDEEKTKIKALFKNKFGQFDECLFNLWIESIHKNFREYVKNKIG